MKRGQSTDEPTNPFEEVEYLEPHRVRHINHTEELIEWTEDAPHASVVWELARLLMVVTQINRVRERLLKQWFVD